MSHRYISFIHSTGETVAKENPALIAIVQQVDKSAELVRQYRDLAESLLGQYNLLDWTFHFNTNKRRLGVCKYHTKRIEISIHHIGDSFPQVRNTILHEVAHAIVGRGQKHNFVWRRKAIEIGCDGARCGEAMQVTPKYIGTCPNGHTVNRFRRPKKPSSCVKCCPKFNLNFLFTFRAT